MGELRSPVIEPFEFDRDYVDFILIEIDRFEESMTRTLLSFLQKRYGDDFWYRIDISGNNKVDAYLIAGPEKEENLDVIHIYSIAVRREYEGKGWAKMLLLKLLEDAANADKEAIVLEVKENNSRAYNLYKHLGFATTGREEGYYKNEIDAIKMRYDIKS